PVRPELVQRRGQLHGRRHVIDPRGLRAGRRPIRSPAEETRSDQGIERRRDGSVRIEVNGADSFGRQPGDGAELLADVAADSPLRIVDALGPLRIHPDAAPRQAHPQSVVRDRAAALLSGAGPWPAPSSTRRAIRSKSSSSLVRRSLISRSSAPTWLIDSAEAEPSTLVSRASSWSWSC